MSWRTRLLELLRVPHAPSAPAGDRDVRIFRAAPNYYTYRLLNWAWKNATAAVGIIFGLGFLRGMPDLPGRFNLLGFAVSPNDVFWILEFGAIAGFVAQAVGTLLLLRLDFEQRWYIVSDRSLRIREGIVRLHEKTMTFANIQHVTIRQGPLQRVLGISDLEVRTAGGGGGTSQEEGGAKGKRDLHIGYFRGLADAPSIRNAIRERLRRHADAGLGDPDDDAPPRSGGLLVAARALAEEARGLRADLNANG